MMKHLILTIILFLTHSEAYSELKMPVLIVSPANTQLENIHLVYGV